MKEKTSKGTPSGEDEKLFNELTSLNNELMNLQRELSKKNVELERLNELKNQFLGMAAHDLRNPLGAIQSFSKLLLDERAGKLSGKQEKYVNIIHRSSRFMLQLIEELLDFSHVESGKLALTKTRFDFVELARQNIQLFTPIARNKDITLRFQPADDEINIEADQGKIEQVLHNLIGNAIKFSHPDSTVTVHAREENGQLFFSVSDHGTGIAAEDQQKLFVPFQPISKNGTAGEKGTGLGLSIVKKIVEGHQGKIWLESAEGKGSTFLVSLPK
jgi:signal transduction histidine kinase